MEKKELKPLEIHPRKGGLKFGYVFGALFCLGGIGLFILGLKKGEIFPTIFFFWLLGMFGYEAFDSFRAARVKGPVFSFSKHGFVDHRSNPPQIYGWDKVESVSWTSHSSKGIGYKLLRIDISQLSMRQWIGKFFLHHPSEINSNQIIFQSPTELGKALRKATPRGKFKT